MSSKITREPFLFKESFYVPVISVCIIIVLIQTFFTIYKTDGVSMNPTLQEAEYVLISKLPHKFDKLNRFDVILFKKPNQSKTFIKRVIALPGESISYYKDTLYINGNPVEESFIDLQKKSSDKFKNTQTLSEINVAALSENEKNDFNIYKRQIQSPYYTLDFNLNELRKSKVIPKGYVFVMGDNRPISTDSRYSDIGLVPMKDIIGVAKYTVYPSVSKIK